MNIRLKAGDMTNTISSITKRKALTTPGREKEQRKKSREGKRARKRGWKFRYLLE